MRMRKRKNLPMRIAAAGEILHANPAQHKGRWTEVFGTTGPLHLEIGCGKGGFITGLAAANPDTRFIAVERVENILILAMEKAVAAGLDNVRFLGCDAATLDTVFAPEEISRVYLNFSDPWPPKKHWKRRLTHPRMLAVLDTFLAPGGEVWMKTDNQALFEYSLCSFSAFGWQLTEISLNLHQTELPNVMTEYEANFSAQGMPIYFCRVQKPVHVQAAPGEE